MKHALDAIHVLEDMERLTKDADAQGVLHSALSARPATIEPSPGRPLRGGSAVRV